jgi:hypothetical protein
MIKNMPDVMAEGKSMARTPIKVTNHISKVFKKKFSTF